MRRKMCRKLALAATTLIALSGAPLAHASPAESATTASDTAKTKPATPSPAAAKPAPRKATPEQRAAADRLEPLARATFWAHEYDNDPNDAEAGVKLAAALRTLGQYPQAADAAQHALVIQPNNVDALLEAARAYVASGSGFYAVDPAKRAMVLAPKDWRPPSLLGVAYSQVHRDDDAKAAWAKALELSPNNPAVLSNMAMAMAAQGDAPGAEALLRRAVAQPAATLQERENLTLVLGLEGKLREAETLLRQNLPPEQADANLAYLKALTAAPASAPAPAATAISAPAVTAHSWDAMKAGG